MIHWRSHVVGSFVAGAAGGGVLLFVVRRQWQIKARLARAPESDCITSNSKGAFMRDVEETVSSGLCASCGCCVDVAPDSLEMRLTRVGGLRPLPKREESASAPPSKPSSSAEVPSLRSICVGVEPHYRMPKQSSEQAPTMWDPMWGGCHTLCEAHSSNPGVRFRAATGGVLTTIAAMLLDAGDVAGVYHIKPDRTAAFHDKSTVSTTAAEVLEASGSRYGPVAPLDGLHAALERYESLCFVGKPCDILAARQLCDVNPTAKRKLKYFLSIFCEGPSEMHTYVGLSKRAGVGSLKDVTSIRYRGYGCPGPLRFEDSRRGIIGDLTYSEAWCDPKYPWRLPWRCKLCADSIGLGADLVALDIWPGGDPMHLYPEGQDPGFNWVMTRTEKGEALLQRAFAQGKLTRAEKNVTFDMVADAQPQHVRRRGAALARHSALRILGVPCPNYGDNVPFWGAAWKFGLRKSIEEFIGTWRRARKRFREDTRDWDFEADEAEVASWGTNIPSKS